MGGAPWMVLSRQDDPHIVTTVRQIRARLSAREPRKLSRIRGSRAAVALVLAGSGHGLGLCVLKRAERPGDRWSGDMAFPGGWMEPTDATPVHTAMRETYEEIGLELDRHQHLGDLDAIRIPVSPHPGEDHAVLCPAVFYVGRARPCLVPDGSEISAGFWVTLEHFLRGSNRTAVPYRSTRYPGVRYRGEIIWGLTYRVFEAFEALALGIVTRDA